MQKYRYEYVKIQSDISFLVPNEISQHREIIDEYASNGWRYVGYIPTMLTKEGRIMELDLIFEQGTE